LAESIAFCLSGNLAARSLTVCHCDEPGLVSIATKTGAVAGTRSAAPEPACVVPPQPARTSATTGRPRRP